MEYFIYVFCWLVDVNIWYLSIVGRNSYYILRMRSMISKDADKYGTKSMISKHSKHTFREYLIPIDTIDNTTIINTSRRKNNQINPNIISAISD